MTDSLKYKAPIMHAGRKAFSLGSDTQQRSCGRRTKQWWAGCATIVHVFKSRCIHARNSQHLSSTLWNIGHKTMSHTKKIDIATKEEPRQPKNITLPPELWIAAAELLPRSSLPQLISVSKLFYEIGMDILHGEVEMELNNYVAQKKFEYNLQPDKAKRIKHLKLSIQYTPSFPMHSEVSEVTSTAFCDREDGNDDNRSLCAGFINFREAMAAFLRALPEMRRIRTLSLHATETTILPGPFSFDGLLSTIWKACSPTLDKISYRGYLSHLEFIIRSPPPKLKLALALDLPSVNSGDAALSKSNGDEKLISGLTSVSRQLQSLHLKSSRSEDMSAVYAALRDCASFMPTDLGLQSSTSTMSQSSALIEFLDRVSPTLERFTVHYPGSWVDKSMGGAETTWNKCLVECLDRPESFANIRVLSIYPTGTDSGLNTLLAFIRNSQSNLEEIRIEERYWEMSDIVTIANALKPCRNLRYLKLSCARYDSSLIDCLAGYLPNLWGLYLNIDGSGRAGLDSRRYGFWKLYDLTIIKGGYLQAKELMKELAEQVPSVKSFYGRGTMDIGDDY